MLLNVIFIKSQNLYIFFLLSLEFRYLNSIVIRCEFWQCFTSIQKFGVSRFFSLFYLKHIHYIVQR